MSTTNFESDYRSTSAKGSNQSTASGQDRGGAAAMASEAVDLAGKAASATVSTVSQGSEAASRQAGRPGRVAARQCRQLGQGGRARPRKRLTADGRLRPVRRRAYRQLCDRPRRTDRRWRHPQRRGSGAATAGPRLRPDGACRLPRHADAEEHARTEPRAAQHGSNRNGNYREGNYREDRGFDRDRFNGPR